MPDGSYSWSEDDDFLEVLIPVPASTKSRDISMELTSRQIKLAVAGMDVLVGQLRGKISPDGSYWSIESTDKETESTRAVALRLEKKVGGMYDPEEWMGVVLDPREANSTLIYDVEKDDQFDVKEYINAMGGYDEDLVDKTMFSGVAKDVYDNMMKSGLVNDVVGPPRSERGGVEDAQVLSGESSKMGSATATRNGEQEAPLFRMTVVKLKAALRARGLSVTGRKAVLVQRLASAISEAEESNGTQTEANQNPDVAYE